MNSMLDRIPCSARSVCSGCLYVRQNWVAYLFSADRSPWKVIEGTICSINGACWFCRKNNIEDNDVASGKAGGNGNKFVKNKWPPSSLELYTRAKPALVSESLLSVKRLPLFTQLMGSVLYSTPFSERSLLTEYFTFFVLNNLWIDVSELHIALWLMHFLALRFRKVWSGISLCYSQLMTLVFFLVLVPRPNNPQLKLRIDLFCT